jgi:hypothetical protein
MAPVIDDVLIAPRPPNIQSEAGRARKTASNGEFWLAERSIRGTNTPEAGEIFHQRYHFLYPILG